LLAPASAFEIVAWRIVLSLVFCAILLTATRGWRRLFTLMRERRIMLTLAVAGIPILINWLVYVLAALSGQVVQASLGYFMNPILTVLLGVVVLIEENLQMGLYLRPRLLAQRLAAMYELFPVLGERRSQRAGGLSGGERQSVAMARALMMDPSVLLLDEPPAGLSTVRQDETFLRTRRINATGVSVVMVE